MATNIRAATQRTIRRGRTCRNKPIHPSTYERLDRVFAHFGDAAVVRWMISGPLAERVSRRKGRPYADPFRTVRRWIYGNSDKQRSGPRMAWVHFVVWRTIDHFESLMAHAAPPCAPPPAAEPELVAPEAIGAREIEAEAEVLEPPPAPATAPARAPEPPPVACRALERVPFGEVELLAVEVEGQPFVVLKRVCEVLGIDTENQRKKLKRHAWAVTVIVTATGSDGKNYEMAALALKSVPMWLATIDESRVAPAVVPMLKRCQLHLHDVLANHFFPRPAPAPAPAGGIHDLVAELRAVLPAGFASVRGEIAEARQHAEVLASEVEARALAATRALDARLASVETLELERRLRKRVTSMVSRLAADMSERFRRDQGECSQWIYRAAYAGVARRGFGFDDESARHGVAHRGKSWRLDVLVAARKMGLLLEVVQKLEGYVRATGTFPSEVLQ